MPLRAAMRRCAKADFSVKKQKRIRENQRQSVSKLKLSGS